MHPFETDTKGKLSSSLTLNWATNRNWQTKVLGTWQVTQMNLPRQESVKDCRPGLLLRDIP